MNEFEELKAEVKYIPLQGDYLLVHKKDLQQFIQQNYVPVKDMFDSQAFDTYMDLSREEGIVEGISRAIEIIKDAGENIAVAIPIKGEIVCLSKENMQTLAKIFITELKKELDT
jgi:bifunctional pyridoxal-dependent enzyme with beta-cystathionase and maltose regulon repressor activities